MKMTEVRGQGSEISGKSILTLYGFLPAIICVLLLMSCAKEEKIYKESRILMDTFCSITVASPSKDAAQRAIETAFYEIKKLEKLLNYFAPDSEISSINNAAGIKPVKVSKETIEVIKKALSVSEVTDGAFDPSIASVIKLWKFSDKSGNSSLPSRKEVESAVKLVDYKKVKVNDKSSEVFLEEKGMELDLGGIAKGYAADKAVKALKNSGIKSALVAIAGDIRGFGENKSGNGWKIGIQNPRPAKQSDKPWEEIFSSLLLVNRAVSTSGDYQRFFIKEGKRYHHIIDPDTGWPSDSGLMSSTVIAHEGYLADSLSTAVFVMGEESGIKLLESMDLEGVLVTSDRKVHITNKLKDNIKLLRNEFKIISP